MKYYRPYHGDETSVGILFMHDYKIYNSLGEKDFRYDLQRGEEVKDWNERNRGYFRRDGERRDILPNVIMMVGIVSTKLKEILEEEVGINKNIKQVQFLPITLEHMTDKEYPLIKDSYYIMNILNILDNVIDKERSTTDCIGWHDVKILPEKAEGYDIFRCRTYEVAYIISERIKKVFENKKKRLLCKKIKFLEM